MAKGLILAWLLGLGLIGWREATVAHKPPPPGRLAAASGVYAGLGLLAQYQPAAPAATLGAWAFTLALVLAPGTLPGTSTPAQRGQQGGPPPTPSGQQSNITGSTGQA
jgi:hypothetical protein